MDDLGELKKRYDSRGVNGETDVNEEVGNEVVNDDEEHEEAQAVTGMAQYQHTSRSGLMGESSPAVFSVQGHYSGSELSSQGFSCTTLDGYQLEMAALGVSCELTPLLVQPAEHEDHLHDAEHDDQPVGLDSLHGVIVSTGFYLD